MSNRIPPYFHTLKSAAVVGLFGGEFSATVDLICLQRTTQSIPYLVVALSFLKVMFIYSLSGTLFMAIVASFFYGLLHLSGLRVNERSLWALHIGIFSYFATMVGMSQLLNIYEEPTHATILGVVLLSFCSSWAVGKTFRNTLPRLTSFRVLGRLEIFILFLCLFAAFHHCEPAKTNATSDYSKAINFQTQKFPNILWIVLDTVRADHLSCYGYRRQTSPAIDRIAKEGVLYCNAISNAPWSYPSHASMLTGLTPTAIGNGTVEWAWLDSKFETVPEWLKKNGYHTAAISENVGLFSPEVHLDKGFEQFKLVPQYHPLESLSLVQIVHYAGTITQRSVSLRIRQLRRMFLNAVESPEYQGQGRRANNLAIEQIDTLTKTNTPFFLFINYMEAHSPYGDTPYANRFLGEISMSLSEAQARAKGDATNHLRLHLKQTILSPLDIAAYNALYDGDISYLDEKVGQLVDSLRQRKLLDNTILIITADHGEYLGEENFIGHGDELGYCVLHVPLIIRYPPLFHPEQREKRWVQLLDIFPTLVDIVKTPEAPVFHLEGKSLLRLQDNARNIISEVFLQLPWHPYNSMRTLMDKNPGISEDSVRIGGKESLFSPPLSFCGRL